jgi:hypothetical protein
MLATRYSLSLERAAATGRARGSRRAATSNARAKKGIKATTNNHNHKQTPAIAIQSNPIQGTMPTMTDDLNHPEHQEHTFIEQEGVTAEYWDEHRLGELHAAAQYAAAELNEGGVEDEHQQYYDHDVIVPTLPAVESPLHGSLKPKALSVHDLKWNKHIEGSSCAAVFSLVFVLPLCSLTLLTCHHIMAYRIKEIQRAAWPH